MRSHAARGFTVGWLVALDLGALRGALAQGTPGWALGEQPNVARAIPPAAAWYLVNAVTPNW